MPAWASDSSGEGEIQRKVGRHTLQTLCLFSPVSTGEEERGPLLAVKPLGSHYTAEDEC